MPATCGSRMTYAELRAAHFSEVIHKEGVLLATLAAATTRATTTCVARPSARCARQVRTLSGSRLGGATTAATITSVALTTAPAALATSTTAVAPTVCLTVALAALVSARRGGVGRPEI